MTHREALALAAAALNDQERQMYTDTALLPYYNMALIELSELFALNNIPATDEESALINVPLGTENIGFSSTPALPSNLIEINNVYESGEGQEYFVPMSKRDKLPPKDSTNLSAFGAWAWTGQEINLYPLINDMDIKIDYIKTLFPTPLILSQIDNNLDVVNAASFLYNRAAGLAADFIGENPTRAEKCNAFAAIALDRSLGISIKSKQSIIYRRRPFRASYHH